MGRGGLGRVGKFILMKKLFAHDISISWGGSGRLSSDWIASVWVGSGK